MNATFWLAGQFVIRDGKTYVHSIQGLYSSADKALEEARGAFPDEWFAGPLKLDETFPEEVTDWPGIQCRRITGYDNTTKVVTVGP